MKKVIQKSKIDGTEQDKLVPNFKTREILELEKTAIFVQVVKIDRQKSKQLTLRIGGFLKIKFWNFKLPMHMGVP